MRCGAASFRAGRRHGRRHLPEQVEAGEFLQRHERAWLFVEIDDLKRIEEWRPRLEEVARGADPGNGYVLFRSGMR